VFSLHNYHTVCPQVYLMKEGRRPCHDFNAGHDCALCFRGVRTPGEERAHRASYHTVRVDAAAPTPGLGARVSALFAPPKPLPSPPIAYPGRPAEVFTDILEDERPRTLQGHNGTAPPQAVGPRNPAELEPLDNTANPDPSFTPAANTDFAQRRRAMVDMLSRCERVLAVSNFVKAKFEALGVTPAAITTQHIGSRMPELAHANPECLAPPPPFTNNRPVRAVFLGYNNYYKGLPMLADALEQVEPALLARLHLCVFAKDLGDLEWRFNALEPRLAGLSIRHGYNYTDIPRLLQNKDVGLVPSVWWDNGPQTVMEFFACGVPVIAANLGGIPDIAMHEHNALLHRGNDRADLALTLARVLRDPDVLFHLRRHVKPPKTMAEHAAEVERVYLECLSGTRAETPSAVAAAG
jgi:hypothetical protein